MSPGFTQFIRRYQQMFQTVLNFIPFCLKCTVKDLKRVSIALKFKFIKQPVAYIKIVFTHSMSSLATVL